MIRLPILRASVPVLAAAFAFARTGSAQDTAHVVVVATTDVHGRVYHWDYQRDVEAPWGLTRAATIVDSLRNAYPGSVVVLDAGDLIQGEPFAAYFATESPAVTHPVVDALNGVGYDAMTPGNHEFNFGLDVLARATATAAFPVVSANIYRLPRDTFAYVPFTVFQRGGVRVGVTGVTTPGVMVWDGARLTGRLVVRRIPESADRVLRLMADAGADLRIVIAHSGFGGGSSYDTTGVGAENVAARLATLDVKPHLVIVGHTHRTVADSVIEGVHFMQPREWARGLGVAHITLIREGTGFRVSRITAESVSLQAVAPEPALSRRLAAAHEAVRGWVNRPLARLEGDWSARTARAEDTPVIDFVNEVQRRTAGAQLSATAAFNPSATFGPYEVRRRDVAALYPYENTLAAVRIDGTRLRAYLERSAAYFRTWDGEGPVATDSIPGYNFDIVSGVEYVIDLSRPVGQRIRQLAYQGRLVTAADSFTLALNNYRQGGGGGFEMLRGLPVTYTSDQGIRDLLIAEIRRLGLLRTEDFFTPSWSIIPPDAREAALRAARNGRRN
jgi:2',3'-cyclic-nucleotide 2'-phosphodiesterase/3'-nucleotidase